MNDAPGNAMRIEWDEASMGTGFPEIDAQHLTWLSRFNAFIDAVNHNQGRDMWSEALLFFIRYTERHFAFEERLMKDNDCVTAARNREEHAAFRKRLEEVAAMTWPFGPTEEDVFALQRELSTWLRRHICTIDIQLRDHAKRV